MFYHVYNRSIAKFSIFNDADEFLRLFRVIAYYHRAKRIISFSRFLRTEPSKLHVFRQDELYVDRGKEFVDIIAYCLMPTHIHFILREIVDGGIAIFSNNVLNSYTRYFNLRHRRKGPLWESRSKKILIQTDEQLLHLSRYIHLNPVTDYLTDRPERWEFSSFCEYVRTAPPEKRICRFEDFIDVEAEEYRKFVMDRVSYQRELAKIKHLMVD